MFTSDEKWITVESIERGSIVQTYNILSYQGNRNYFANGLLLVYEDYQTLSYLVKEFLKSDHPLLSFLYFLKGRNYETESWLLWFINLLPYLIKT